MPPHDDRPTLSWVGDRHLRLSLESHSSSDLPAHAHHRVHAAYQRLRAAPIAGLCDLIPASATILLAFDPANLDHQLAETQVLDALRHPGALPDPALSHPAPSRTIAVPVCYHPEFAPDLAEVAALHNLSLADVVSLHSAPRYTVLFLGFSPGFPYLAGLPAPLATPRLDRPRTRVPAGSVGIATDQTGIYPHPTPGGWRLIGRTPLRLFDAARAPPSLLTIGDRVRFIPITPAEFRASTPHAPGGA